LSNFVAPVSAFAELVEVSLKPMEKPSPLSMAAGTERHWLEDGKQYIIYYESVDAEN